MPLGYKYAERDANNETNWAEVGRSVSGMLLETNRLRQEKKDAYDESTRKAMNDLAYAPQGENQDANDFINNYAHDMINQKKIDNDLFKRGQMSERDFTLKMQNQMDGTNQLFDIQKLYQDKYKEKMDGVTSGKLQAMNIFNMGMVEGYGDFNNSKATINPYDGTVGIGLMENQIIDGKTVRVLSKNIAPVNVIRGKILHDVPTFDVDLATTNAIKNFGTRKDVLYQAATVSRAGTITEFLGIESMKNHPEFAGTIKNMNDAINNQIGSYFAQSPYNLSSVLTENTGKYNAQSYTFSKEEAAADKSKILVKVDPNTTMTTLDTNGPNYEAQKKEAAAWVRTDMLSKMDSEKSIKTTAQNQLQETAEQREAASRKTAALAAGKSSESAAGAWNQLYTGKTAAEKKVAADILLGTDKAKKAGLLGIDMTENGVIKLNYADPTKNRSISYLDAQNRPISKRDFAGLGVELHGVEDREKAMRAGGATGAFGNVTDLSGVSSNRQGAVDVSEITPDLFTVKSTASTERLKSILPTTFSVVDKGGVFGNDVEVTAPNGNTYPYNANVSAEKAAQEAISLANFIKANSGTTTVQSGKPKQVIQNGVCLLYTSDAADE